MSNQSCFNVKLWTVDQVLLWIKGLGEFANQYVGNFEKNYIDGCRLLILTNCDLIDMGINKLRDQEIILQGINLLQYMTYEMMNETLKTCASRLEVACTNLVNLIKHIDIKLNTETRDSRFVLESRMAILRSIENTLKYIFSMMSWINRLESDDDSNYEDEKQTLILCSQILSSCSKKDVPGSILRSACEQLIGMCLEVIQNSNDLLNSQPCSLDVIQINKQGDQKLGLEIRCLINGTPYISLIEENSLSAASGEFEVKDEIIQVNDQTVLGWDVKILKQFIDSSHNKVKFTIKKKPELSYASSVGRKFVKKKKCKKVRIKDGTLTKDGICSSSEGNLLSRLEELSRKLSEVPPLQEDRLLQVSSPWLPREDRRPSLDGDGNPTSVPDRGRIRLRILPKFITEKTKKLCNSLESLLNNDSAPQSPNILRKVISNKGNKRMSCHDMGGTDCRGWVWVKQELKGASVFSSLEKWRTYWVVLKWRVVHFYKDPKDDAPFRSFSLLKCKFSPLMSQNKFSFKVWNDDDVYIFASGTKEDMLKWMNKMALASLDDLNAEDLHTIGGFQTYHKKNESESAEVLDQQKDDVDKRSDTDDDLKRWYGEIQRADIGLDGRNEKMRRSAILTASKSLMGHSNMNVLKLLSLNRMLKDKMQKLEAIENFLNQQPITPKALEEFQHHNPVCILDAASDIKITESDV